MSIFRSIRPVAFLRKGVLKICSKFTGEIPCRSAISVKLQSNFWVAASECCKLGARRFFPYDPKIIGDTPKNVQKASKSHCVKSALIRSYSGPHFSRIFPAFSRIPTECGAYLSVFSPNAGNCGKNGDQNNSEHGHFLRSFCLNVVIWLMTVNGFNEAKNEKQII